MPQQIFDSLLNKEIIETLSDTTLSENIKKYDEWLNNSVRKRPNYFSCLNQGKIINILEETSNGCFILFHLIHLLYIEINNIVATRESITSTIMTVSRIQFSLRTLSSFISAEHNGLHNILFFALENLNTMTLDVIEKIDTLREEQISFTRSSSSVSDDNSIDTIPHAVEPARKNGAEVYSQPHQRQTLFASTMNDNGFNKAQERRQTSEYQLRTTTEPNFIFAHKIVQRTYPTISSLQILQSLYTENSPFIKALFETIIQHHPEIQGERQAPQ